MKGGLRPAFFLLDTPMIVGAREKAPLRARLGAPVPSTVNSLNDLAVLGSYIEVTAIQ